MNKDAATFLPLPKTAAWRLEVAHEGFEIALFEVTTEGTFLKGTTLGIEDGKLWQMRYEIVLDELWRVRKATIIDMSGRQLSIEVNEHRWIINGRHNPTFDGIHDLDLEGSAVTNTIPVHRLELAVGQAADAPAVYVRTADLSVELLEQGYTRLPDNNGAHIFDYESPRFEYHEQLRFAPDGLVDQYPDIAKRVA